MFIKKAAVYIAACNVFKMEIDFAVVLKLKRYS
jgi:hypothetical protein